MSPTPLIDLRDPATSQRFAQLVSDVRKGKLTVGVVAEEFHCDPKTVRRAIRAYEREAKAEKTYRPVDSWSQVPGAIEWENKVKARLKEPGPWISIIKRIWADPHLWNKRLLSQLTADDMARAVTYAKSRSDAFEYMKALRSLVRLGFGDHAWLTDFMGTKGTKAPPRFPPELKVKETFLSVVPRIQAAKKQMLNAGEITTEQFEISTVVDLFKLKHGARTGDHNEQRSVWGTIINGGKSSLVVDGGQVRHWTDLSKGGRVWEIPREQWEMYPGLLPTVETYIETHALKTGDYLIPKSFRPEHGNEILGRSCEIAELSHFVLHDFRKIALTDKRLAGVPLEAAVKMGEGWDDVATAAKFYESIKNINLEPEYAKIRAFYNGGSHN